MRKMNRWMLLVLLILFCLVGTLLIRIGIVSYKNEQLVSMQQLHIRMPSDYITSQIREHNVAYPIEVRMQGGYQVLVLLSEEEGMVYETWIYCLNHKLYEAYVSVGSTLRLESGKELMELENLEFKKGGKCLTVTFETKDQKSYELLFEGGSQ